MKGYLLLSFLIVAFGQAAWLDFFGPIAAAIGYALFFYVLIQFPRKKDRFWLGTGWFGCVLLLQFSWMLSHPFNYIYALWIILSFVFAMQFGLLSLFITAESVKSIRTALFVSGLWVLCEWSRLFILSGFSWSPIGMALASYTIPLQLASIAGVFGLSYWVMFVNMLAIRGWIIKKPQAWLIAAIVPYLFGAAHLYYHAHKIEEEKRTFSAVLVQTWFPIEEIMTFKDYQHYLAQVIDEWDQILKITAQHHKEKVDLIALPEFVVPFGTYSFVFPYNEVKKSFEKYFGKENLSKLPPLELPLAIPEKDQFLVNNAYWSQALSNTFNAAVVVGLEDAEDKMGQREFYSSALFFEPYQNPFAAKRYAKRVLVPMGEYIPFSFCRDLATRYGVGGSFTCGTEAMTFTANEIPFGISICYEETFGHLMRDNKEKGAQLLVNLTSDAWYPTLPKQHLEHARLRTVENGFPLLRACNTGITGATDALGRDIAALPEDAQDSLHIQVPVYHYPTLYSRWGDWLIVIFALLSLIPKFVLFLFD